MSHDDPLAALFDTPQIHTGDDGRHVDDAGLEYDALLIDGETAFAPASQLKGTGWSR